MSLTEKGIQKLLWMLVHCHFSAREMHIKPDVRIIIMTSIPKRLIMVIGQSDWQNRTTSKRESNLITSLITDQMGQHKVLLPINKTMAKFEKETKHLLHDFIKKTKTVTSAKFLQRHDLLNVPLTVQLHCLITLSYYTVLKHCPNHTSDNQSVWEFSFD